MCQLLSQLLTAIADTDNRIARSRQTAATLARVYGPKAHGAWALQRGTAALPLEACALFSSVAALLGGAGQVWAPNHRLSMASPRDRRYSSS